MRFDKENKSAIKKKKKTWTREVKWMINDDLFEKREVNDDDGGGGGLGTIDKTINMN